MKFLKSLFRNRSAERAAIQRYVELEFRSADRNAEYSRLLREARL